MLTTAISTQEEDNVHWNYPNHTHMEQTHTINSRKLDSWVYVVHHLMLIGFSQKYPFNHNHYMVNYILLNYVNHWLKAS